MFREMRRADRQVSRDTAMEILSRAEYGMLATTCEDGYPYTIALSHVVMDGCIYFHCAAQGQKLDNIVRDPRVCFSAVASTQLLPEKFSTKYESAVVFGRAVVIDGDEKRDALQRIAEKYSPQFLEKAAGSIEKSFTRTMIVRITPDHVTGKARK